MCQTSLSGSESAFCTLTFTLFSSKMMTGHGQVSFYAHKGRILGDVIRKPGEGALKGLGVEERT